MTWQTSGRRGWGVLMAAVGCAAVPSTGWALAFLNADLGVRSFAQHNTKSADPEVDVDRVSLPFAGSFEAVSQVATIQSDKVRNRISASWQSSTAGRVSHTTGFSINKDPDGVIASATSDGSVQYGDNFYSGNWVFQFRAEQTGLFTVAMVSTAQSDRGLFDAPTLVFNGGNWHLGANGECAAAALQCAGSREFAIAAGEVYTVQLFGGFSMTFPDGGSGFGTIKDELVTDVFWRVSAVPEPESYALMLAGLALVGAARRQRGHARP